MTNKPSPREVGRRGQTGRMEPLDTPGFIPDGPMEGKTA
jgi:hypothetical protein